MPQWMTCQIVPFGNEDGHPMGNMWLLSCTQLQRMAHDWTMFELHFQDMYSVNGSLSNSVDIPVDIIPCQWIIQQCNDHLHVIRTIFERKKNIEWRLTQL